MKTYHELADQLAGFESRARFHSSRIDQMPEASRNDLSPEYRRHSRELQDAEKECRALMRTISKHYKKQHEAAQREERIMMRLKAA